MCAGVVYLPQIKRYVLKQYGETIQLMTTYACTMDCPKCVQKPFKNLERGHMTMDEFFCAIGAMSDAKPKKVIISGGEPTLWPHLKEAIDHIKSTLGSKVEVITNGLYKNGEDYGNADIVSVSNYGSINKMDMLRLKGQLGRRYRMLNSCQVPLPFKQNGDNTLPAICNCYNPSFVRGSVYRCPVAGYHRCGAVNAKHYGKSYLGHNKDIIFKMSICRDCLANYKARKRYNNQAVLEISAWNTRIGYTIQLGRYSNIARKVYRKVKGLRA